jgi:LmbE family N-acetylglucosaminyl deacetylase
MRESMSKSKYLSVFILSLVLLAPESGPAAQIVVEGAPSDSGYNVGTAASFRVTLKGVEGDASRYAVFAEIQYIGTTAASSVQLDRVSEPKDGAASYEGGWLIPAEAPTGVYSVKIRVEDRKEHRVAATQKLRGFGAYRKQVNITGVRLDKTFYTVGDTIQCEVAIENLTGRPMSGLRVEFSNANYPWISSFSGKANLSGQEHENPALGLKVLSEGLNLPAHGTATIPMMPAGTVRFLQGQMVAMLGAGGPARNANEPPPEVDQYTVAVWNADRTVLYDMQFSKPAVVRPWNRVLPKPYSNLGYTHPYNSDIDFTRYREFYSPGQISAAIRLDHAHTLFRPGETLKLKTTLANPGPQEWSGVELSAAVSDASGKELHRAALRSGLNFAPGKSQVLEAEAWTIPASLAPGTYNLRMTLVDADGVELAAATTDFAVNKLPASVLVVAPHEDDEYSYAALIRAGVEAGIPVRVVILTGGDVGECERYYSKPCGPNEAREFGQIRMEESAEELEHMGLARDKLSILGLPDGGSGEIWFHHIKVSDPFLSIYLATDHAPYENVVRPNLPFARDAVIDQLKQIIAEFRPALIATAHPDERHVDHRTTNWFVVKACQELLRDKKIDPETVLVGDEAYGAGGFNPAPYHYEKAPVFLSGEAAALKQEASWIYQSQDGNLHEGAKQSFEELPRVEMHYRIVDWQEHEGWNE